MGINDGSVLSLKEVCITLFIYLSINIYMYVCMHIYITYIYGSGTGRVSLKPAPDLYPLQILHI